MNKITVTSTLAILIAGPAMAAVGDATFTAGQNVANSCVVGVLGVDSGTAQTNAYWNPKTYACAAGTYLPDGDTWSSDNQYTSGNCKQCTAGNYCAGSGSTPFTYSEANDQGIQSCPSGYANSDAGSDAESDCYRTCAVGDVEHLKSGGTMTGRYYSDNTNTCAPSDDQQCATGYHYVAGAPDLNTAIGTVAGSGSYSGTTFSVTYSGKGTITGNAQCSTRSATNPRVGPGGAYVLQSDGTTTTLPDGTGRYCYCQLTEYTPDGGNSQSLSAPWVFYSDYSGAGDCANRCAYYCESNLQDDFFSPGFRAAVFGSVQPTPASCQANKININWKDASGETFNLGECTYDGALTTPSTAPTKRGHTFGGWRFVAQP